VAEHVRIPALFGHRFRFNPDRIPGDVGQCSDSIRTAFRSYPDRVPTASGHDSGRFGQRSGPIRTRFRRYSDSSRRTLSGVGGRDREMILSGEGTQNVEGRMGRSRMTGPCPERSSSCVKSSKSSDSNTNTGSWSGSERGQTRMALSLGPSIAGFVGSLVTVAMRQFFVLVAWTREERVRLWPTFDGPWLAPAGSLRD
jgi:hypothetical protein